MKRQQSGFTLLEMSIVVMLGMMLIAAGLIVARDKLIEERAKALGQQAMIIANGVSSYTTNQYQDLLSGVGPLTVNGVNIADRMAPTVAELVNAGVISGNMSNTNIYGSGWRIFISLQPGGCTPSVNCDIQAVTILDTPVLDGNGRADLAVLGTAASEAGANAGVTYPDLMPSGPTATIVSGLGGAWTIPNPDAGQRPGLLAIRTGYGASGMSQFLRRDGSLPMTGNLQLGNNDITQINNFNAVNGVMSQDIAARNMAASQTVGAYTGAAPPWSGGTWVATNDSTGRAQSNQNIVGAGGLQVNGNAAVTGGATINGAATVGTNLSVGGSATVAAGIGVGGAAAPASGLTSAGPVLINNTLTATGAAALDGGITVGGNLFTVSAATGDVGSRGNVLVYDGSGNVVGFIKNTGDAGAKNAVGIWDAVNGWAGYLKPATLVAESGVVTYANSMGVYSRGGATFAGVTNAAGTPQATYGMLVGNGVLSVMEISAPNADCSVLPRGTIAIDANGALYTCQY